MHTSQNPIDRQSAAETLLAKYVNRDVNLIEVERMYHDMVLRYFHPADGWNPIMNIGRGTLHRRDH